MFEMKKIITDDECNLFREPLAGADDDDVPPRVRQVVAHRASGHAAVAATAVLCLAFETALCSYQPVPGLL